MGTISAEKPTGASRIELRFEYSKTDLFKVKEIPGRRFNDTNKLDKHWRVPLDMATCRHLRELFGKALHIGPNLRSWAIEQNRLEASLGTISTADSAVLENLPTLLPRLHRALYVGPLGVGKTEAELDAMMEAAAHGSFQTADVAYLAQAENPLNANQPGLGKTLETIGAIYERYGTNFGRVLVVAPKVALESVWQKELEAWQPAPVYVLDGAKKASEATVAAFAAHRGPAWLVVNQEKLRWRKDPTNAGKIAIVAKQKEWASACKCDRLKDPHWHYAPPFPELQNTEWTVIVVDECHKGAIRNSRTITAMTLNAFNKTGNGKKMALSGTPMKNTAEDLWGVLHWLNPKEFGSLWNWAGRWCEIIEGDYGKKIGPLREDRKLELFRSLTPYVLRRTKKECAPWLPDKRFIEVPCHMEGEQLRQYGEMSADASVRMGDERVAATIVLSEFLRLTQFAIAAWTINGAGKLVPTESSCKLDQLDRILQELGIFDNECEEKVVVFSQFEQVVSMIVEHLRRKKVEVVTITGKVNKPGQRGAIQKAFQEQGGARVIAMTTSAGGVAITLDAADTVVFFDEMWTPADQEQAEDRVHRVSRLHQVTVYYLRTVNSIDQYRMETVEGKALLHREILDVRRRFLADQKGKAA